VPRALPIARASWAPRYCLDDDWMGAVVILNASSHDIDGEL
jgi:hypothetical protein